jgi:DNA-binding NarL/FixJ family response regulator
LIAEVISDACRRDGIRVVGPFADGHELRDAHVAHRVDVVVVPDDMIGVPVDRLIDEVSRAGGRVILLGSDPAPAHLSALLARGAQGYLLYDAAPQEVVTGIRAVARGAVAVNHTAAAHLVADLRRTREQSSASSQGPRALTPREREVLVAMAGGGSAREVARALTISVKTVENHKIRIFEKLGVRSQAHAIAVAVSSGLIPAAYTIRPIPPLGFDERTAG